MEYQALYRKYRPQSFDEVVGQAHVTSTISREVADGRVAHAYLFAGPRGTGKTTTARILAKALNCENRNPDGSPDNECESCVAITEGTSLDVMEMDAASHNSVEDIRDIRVSVTTVASHAGSKRVFILDEAHMLSKAAGNALLKTLEEPPDHVHFVLATTEPYKLLDTIRSRSQRFDFHPVPIEALAAHLGRIADLEGYRADPGALVAVARHAAGSARDSLSLLEQVAALGDGTVDVAGVRRALGLADSEAYSRLADAIASHDATAALHLVAELAADGVDLRRFVSEGVGYFRGVFLAHYAPNLEEVADEPAEMLEAWRKAAAVLPSADVLRAVDLLGEALIRLREGREERLMTELALIKLTRPEVTSDPDALAARIGRLERKIDSLGERGERGRRESEMPAAESPTTAPETPREPDPESPAEPEPAAAEASASPPSPPEEPAPAAPEAPPLDFAQVQEIWPGLFGSLRDVLGARRWALFREVVPGGVDGSTIILHVPHLFHLEQLQEDRAVAKVVSTRAGDLLGREVSVRFASPESEASPSGPDQETEEIDLSSEQLFEGPRQEVDPTRLLEEELGAQLVEDDD